MCLVWLLFRDGQRPVSQVSGLSKTKHYVPGRKNPEQNGKRGCAQISGHHCELASSTSNDHNFFVRTPICVFLDFIESLFN